MTKKIFSRVQIKSKSISFSTKQNSGLKHSIYTNNNNIISLINKEKFMLSTDKIQIKGIHNIQNSYYEYISGIFFRYIWKNIV